MRRYDRSAELLGQARRVTPGGSQTMSKQACRFPAGAYPAFLRSGKGCHVWDVDGNRYTDWICGLAAITLGHGHPAVTEAIQKQLFDGVLFSLPHRLEAEVAGMLCENIPCAEQVRFVKTGSEATEAAIRVARAATGRDVILTVGSGYHSWHSWFAAVKPEHPGVPAEMTELIRPFRYNDLDSLQEIIDLVKYAWAADDAPGPEIAAIIMEPTLIEAPDPGFLEGVRALARRHGALLIFDEIVTGFRWAIAGGQEYFGVVPDLACFGKGVANGMPLACLVGPRDLMRHAELVSGTFGGECLSLAAAKAAIEVYRSEPVVETLWRSGATFQEGLRQVIAECGLPAEVVGYPVHPMLRWQHPEARLLMSLFLQETAARGVLLHPSGWNVNYALRPLDIHMSLHACAQALRVVKVAEDSGDPGKWLLGEPCQDAPIRSPQGG